MDLRSVGHQIGIHRKARHLNQHELAQQVHLSRNYLSLIERGEAPQVSFSAISRLATTLGLTLTALLEHQPRVSDTIPVSLRTFGTTAGLRFEVVDILARLPRRGHEPKTVEEWQHLYTAIRRYIDPDCT